MKNNQIIMNGISSSWDEAITGFDALWPTIPPQYVQQAEGGRSGGEVHGQHPDKGAKAQHDPCASWKQRIVSFRGQEQYQ